ncbi:MAG: cobyric acid synthase [Syntrophobacteraceae bacterium]|jgi:cobyric acid synthase CobQ/L-threonine-O-3-phosphate decarboxylase
MVTHGHGGNVKQLAEAAGRTEKDLLDFSANINPLGLPEWFRSLISSRISSLVQYPDSTCSILVQTLASNYGVSAEEVLIGNGSTELLYLLPRAVPKSRAVIPVPSYLDYRRVCELAGLTVEEMLLREDNGFRLDLSALDLKLHGDELVVVGQPNNPTGLLVDPEAIRALAFNHPSTVFIVDEAFADFIDGLDSLINNRPPNVVVLYSLTKFYAIPGLRLGCAVADRNIARQVRRIMPPWTVNTLAQAVGEAALQDNAYAVQTRTLVRALREELYIELQSIPNLTVYPGKANFLLVRIDREDIDVPTLARKMLSDGIAIRDCGNFEGLDGRFFRVAVRTAEENALLCQSIRKSLGIGCSTPKSLRKTPAIMFQGTSSNAGKSVLTAAMCRILLQDGYRVAPFKSQNMALNSFVTWSGGEMGRAQVVQAQACRLDPDVRMNPILLKPGSDTGAQVMVWGQPVGNMDVSQYISYKTEAFAKAKDAFASLAGEYEVIVMEGAGSPGEVNLKHHDIVNMNMARHAGAPVLLVGDIDRGGVFASFVGTMEVLTEWERKLLAGFVINKFRGEESLLDSAIEFTQRRTGRPIMGVVPFLRDLGLPEEDSVGFKSGVFDDTSPSDNGLEIAIIDLPHISNFTDFDPLRIEPDVHLRVVRSAQDLNQPDALVLPGSKNVIEDLRYLQQTGLDRKIIDLATRGKTEVIGICGGFQILGLQIADPHGIESGGKTIEGLGLLPVVTVLAKEKILTRVKATHLPSGLAVQGYEIHHGQTDGAGLMPVVRRQDGELIGGGMEGGSIWGTYLHGFFDANEVRRWFIDRLRVRRGLPALGTVRAVYDLEPALDRLADTVRSSLRMHDIYRLMGLK